MNEFNRAENGGPQGTEQGAAADAGSEPGGQALAAAKAEAKENWNSYLRVSAEMENFRKRSEREVENARKFAIERFAQELVTVGDSLEAGIAAGAANPGPALLEGAEATLRQLHRAFDKAGIKIIDPARPSIRHCTRPWWRRTAPIIRRIRSSRSSKKAIP